jgi:hypothetical protein
MTVTIDYDECCSAIEQWVCERLGGAWSVEIFTDEDEGILARATPETEIPETTDK